MQIKTIYKSELKVRLARLKTSLSPPVKYFTDHSKAVLFLWIFYVFSVLRLLCLCARLFICALWSPAGRGVEILKFSTGPGTSKWP